MVGGASTDLTARKRIPKEGSVKIFLSMIDGLNEIVGRLFSWVVVAVMLIAVYDVVMRQVFGVATLWVFDLSKQLYALHFLILGGFALLYSEHVSVDLVYARLSERKQALLDVIGYCVFFFPFVIVLIYYGYQFAARSWASKEATWGVIAMPVYPIKTVIVVAAVLLGLQGIATFVRRLSVLVSGQEVGR
ncbi:MAG: TRAP transporter small permease subunit [Alphaproteobacteria bacterium]|nr:TRAP transporter small permease subunit [Alphaproteobacteria bacterium]MCB9929936.1 TRAP transporter small permease subunit [Alphaproteobacteria bacterium]